MSPDILIEDDIIDHRCCWTPAGSDGACLNRCRIERRATLKSPPGINPVIEIGVGPRIVSPRRRDLCQLRPRSEIAGPVTTTKSP
jgi:hypothetical protein